MINSLVVGVEWVVGGSVVDHPCESTLPSCIR